MGVNAEWLDLQIKRRRYLYDQMAENGKKTKILREEREELQAELDDIFEAISDHMNI